MLVVVVVGVVVIVMAEVVVVVVGGGGVLRCRSRVSCGRAGQGRMFPRGSACRYDGLQLALISRRLDGLRKTRQYSLFFFSGIGFSRLLAGRINWREGKKSIPNVKPEAKELLVGWVVPGKGSGGRSHDRSFPMSTFIALLVTVGGLSYCLFGGGLQQSVAGVGPLLSTGQRGRVIGIPPPPPTPIFTSHGSPTDVTVPLMIN